ncbi:MAG: hypothetical protein AABZ55_08775 [Bdellovibrionota bacterium]
MSDKAQVYPLPDSEWDSIIKQVDVLDQYLRVQNLRRIEEEFLIRVIESGETQFSPTKTHPNLAKHLALLLFVVVTPNLAFAANLEATLQNLVNAFTSRLLPILAVGYLGKNIFSHIQGDPNAKNETIRVVVAIACLVGLSGVWTFITSQVR